MQHNKHHIIWFLIKIFRYIYTSYKGSRVPNVPFDVLKGLLQDARVSKSAFIDMVNGVIWACITT